MRTIIMFAALYLGSAIGHPTFWIKISGICFLVVAMFLDFLAFWNSSPK